MAKGGGKASGKAQAKAAPKPQGAPKTKRTPGDEQVEIEERVEERDINIDAPVPVGAILKRTNPAIGKKMIAEKIVITKKKRGPDKVETIPGEPAEGEGGGGGDGEGDDFPEKEEHDRDHHRDKPHPEKTVADNRGAPYNAYTQLQHAHAAANLNSPSRMLATAVAMGRMAPAIARPQPHIADSAPANQMPIVIAPAFVRRAIAFSGPRPPIGQLRTIVDVPRLDGMTPDQIAFAGRRPHGRAPLSSRLTADLPSLDQIPDSIPDKDASQQFDLKAQQGRQGARFGAGPAGRAGGPSGPAAAAGGSGAGSGPR